LGRGLEVSATDPAAGAEAALLRFIDAAWPDVTAAGGQGGEWRSRLRFEERLEDAVRSADLVQENGPEREDFKIQLFARLDAAARPDALLASSSSGLLMTNVQRECVRPERCLTAHPFNPPHLIPLVEIVGGERTSADAVERALAFYRAIGKHPIHVRREVPGHIANRLQAALWREAFYLVEQGVASVADVDAAISQGPGIRWALYGPIALQHLSGGDAGLPHVWKHLMPAVQQWWTTLGTPVMNDELGAALAAGAIEELGDVPVAELERRRDRGLVRILQALKSEKDPVGI